MISRSGAAGGRGPTGSCPAISSAIRFGSGRTASTSPSAAKLIAPAASHGTVSALASTSRPANSGPNTAGPRIAPNTEPNSTYEIPRARRSGGYMSPAAVRISSAIPLAAPVSAKPRITREVEPRFVATAVSAQPAARSEEHTSELQSRGHLVCRLLLEKKKTYHQCLTTKTQKHNKKD